MINTMKKMYTEPKTDVTSIEAAMSICHVSGDGHVNVSVTPIDFYHKVE